MNYEKQNFISGQTLKAEHLNHMEDGIGQLSEEIGGFSADLVEFENAITEKKETGETLKLIKSVNAFSFDQNGYTEPIQIGGDAKYKIVFETTTFTGQSTSSTISLHEYDSNGNEINVTDPMPFRRTGVTNEPFNNYLHTTLFPNGGYVDELTFNENTACVKIRAFVNVNGTALTERVPQDWKIYKYESGYEYTIRKDAIIKSGVTVEELGGNSLAKIVLGNLYAVVGDTIQVFFDSIVEGKTDDVVLRIECAKGKNYPRYWEYTPSVSDVGSVDFSVYLYSLSGKEIAKETVSLKTVNAVNPSAKKNILCVGDSTMQWGQIPIEASRRIKGTQGTATSPNPLNLTNIDFVGRKKNEEESVGWEGTGGWSYATYTRPGSTAIRFDVTDATDINIGDTYQAGDFKFDIAEINVTGGMGNIRCTFYYATPYSSSWDDIAQSGTLTKYAGNGQNSIAFNAWTKEAYQPFWNNTTDQFDIVSYANQYCGGKIDVLCVLLGVNTLITMDAFASVDTAIGYAKTFFDYVHTQLPNCKVLASTIPIQSPNGGLASNYGTASLSGEYDSNGFAHKIFAYNQKLIELGKTEAYSYLDVVSSHAQFDAKNGYPTSTKKINTRSNETETIQTNAVHPNDSGYWQLSDALAFRAVIGLLN